MKFNSVVTNIEQDFTGSVTHMESLKELKVTELSVWGKDISILNRSQVPLTPQPIYKKENGIYVPNEMY